MTRRELESVCKDLVRNNPRVLILCWHFSELLSKYDHVKGGLSGTGSLQFTRAISLKKHGTKVQPSSDYTMTRRELESVCKDLVRNNPRVLILCWHFSELLSKYDPVCGAIRITTIGRMIDCFTVTEGGEIELMLFLQAFFWSSIAVCPFTENIDNAYL
jgi:hypothetical protein